MEFGGNVSFDGGVVVVVPDGSIVSELSSVVFFDGSKFRFESLSLGFVSVFVVVFLHDGSSVVVANIVL